MVWACLCHSSFCQSPSSNRDGSSVPEHSPGNRVFLMIELQPRHLVRCAPSHARRFGVSISQKATPRSQMRYNQVQTTTQSSPSCPLAPLKCNIVFPRSSLASLSQRVPNLSTKVSMSCKSDSSPYRAHNNNSSISSEVGVGLGSLVWAMMR